MAEPPGWFTDLAESLSKTVLIDAQGRFGDALFLTPADLALGSLRRWAILASAHGWADLRKGVRVHDLTYLLVDEDLIRVLCPQADVYADIDDLRAELTSDDAAVDLEQLRSSEAWHGVPSLRALTFDFAVGFPDLKRLLVTDFWRSIHDPGWPILRLRDRPPLKTFSGITAGRSPKPPAWPRCTWTRGQWAALFDVHSPRGWAVASHRGRTRNPIV